MRRNRTDNVRIWNTIVKYPTVCVTNVAGRDRSDTHVRSYDALAKIANGTHVWILSFPLDRCTLAMLRGRVDDRIPKVKIYIKID